jgi:hypothetical protein
MNPIEARVGLYRVAILSPMLAMGAHHVTSRFGAVELSRNNSRWPVSGAWHRFMVNGAALEEQDGVHRISSRRDVNDTDMIVPYREFPVEAIEPVFHPAPGDLVLVDSIPRNRVIQARVLPFNAPGLLALDFHAISQDSGSLVTTTDGGFVGFISGNHRDNNGAVAMCAVVPIAETPVVTPPVPPVILPPVISPSPDYIRGFNDAIALGQQSLIQLRKDASDQDG